MIESRQRAYLEAMDIPVWVRKELSNRVPDFIAPQLRLGPGSGSVLLVCSRLDEPATRLAADIVRSLGSEPVWAWLEHDGGGAPEDVVKEHLFTSMVVFGTTLELQLFGGTAPDTLGSARLMVVPGLHELASSPPLKKRLWKMLSGRLLAAKAT